MVSKVLDEEAGVGSGEPSAVGPRCATNPGKETGARRATASMVLGVFGLTLWWPLLRRSNGFYILSGHDGSQGACVGWYTLCLVCVVTVALLVLWGMVRKGVRGSAAGGTARACRVQGGVADKSPGSAGTRARRGGMGLAAASGAQYRRRGAGFALDPAPSGVQVQTGCLLPNCLCTGLFVTCAQAVLKLVELGVHPAGTAAVVLAVVDVMLYAAVFVCLTCVWATWVWALAPRTRAIASALSFALSFCVRMVAVLPAGVDVAVMAVLPALSMACGVSVLRWARPSAAVGEVRALGVPHAVGGAPATHLTGVRPECGPAFPSALEGLTASSANAWGDLRDAFRGATGLIALFLVIAAVARGIVFGFPEGSLLSPILTRQDAMTMVFAGAILVCCLVRDSPSRLPGAVWPFATVVLFAGLFLMAGAAGDMMTAGQETMVVGRTVLDLLFWLMLANAVQTSPLASFAVPFVLVDALSALLGYVAVPVLLETLGYDLGTLSTSLASAVTFALVVASVFFFSRQMEGGGSVVGREGPRTVCDAMSVEGADLEVDKAAAKASAFERMGLTEREERVAFLLAEGNSQKKIAELMGVSLGTVQTHVKAVYRKAGVHSKQELIDLAHR